VIRGRGGGKKNGTPRKEDLPASKQSGALGYWVRKFEKISAINFSLGSRSFL
jgi:hypothetical protein